MPIRFVAFLTHLGGSCVLAALSLGLVFWLWYPAPLASAVGVGPIFLTLLGVDVVLGPLLTLIVYDRSKKRLAWDLGLIVLVQLLAFAWGMRAIVEARPAWLVYSGMRFDLVSANEPDPSHLLRAAEPYRHAPWMGPVWVSARLPQDLRARNELMWSAFRGGEDLPQRPDLYVPLAQDAKKVALNAQPIERLLKLNPANEVARVRARWPQADAYMPLLTKGRPLTVLIQREQGQPVAIVDLKAF
jgi:hypothetical protein